MKKQVLIGLVVFVLLVVVGVLLYVRKDSLKETFETEKEEKIEPSPVIIEPQEGEEPIEPSPVIIEPQEGEEPIEPSPVIIE